MNKNYFKKQRLEEIEINKYLLRISSDQEIEKKIIEILERKSDREVYTWFV